MEKILITAGIHGNEIGSVLIAREIRGWVESRDLDNVTVIPEVNLRAVENKQRENPEDGKDLNRVFPGDENGTRSDRTAHRIFQVARDHDFLIDLHTYGEKSRCIPYMLTDLKEDYNRELCKRVGLKNAVQTGGTEGQLFIETSKHGIPSMIIEAGGAERFREELEEVKSKLLDFLLDEKKRSLQVDFYHHYEWIEPEEEGYFEPKKEPGDRVEKNETIGLIDEKPIKAEFSGLVLGIRKVGAYKSDEGSVASIAEIEG